MIETMLPNGAPAVADRGLARRMLRLLGSRWLYRTKRQYEPFGPKRIWSTTNFSKLFSLGRHVRASGQIGTEVRYANRVSDGKVFVVKVRHKGRCPGRAAFRDGDIEASWRASTELMLKFPDCKHIAGVIEAWEDEVSYYVVMESVEGSDLFDTVHSRQLEEPKLKSIIRQLLLSLQALHAAGIIHRDIKLDNIVLQSDLTIKLVDFDDTEPWPKLKKENTRWICGTDQYIAPEAYSGEYSPSSDLFAAGVVLYRMLFGRNPFNMRLFDDMPGENFVGCPKMEAIRARLERASIGWSKHCGSMLSETSKLQATALCQQLMAVKQGARMSSASAALSHPFFDCMDGPRENTQASATLAYATSCQFPAWSYSVRHETADKDVDVLDLEDAGKFGESISMKAPIRTMIDNFGTPTECSETCDCDLPAPPGWVYERTDIESGF